MSAAAVKWALSKSLPQTEKAVLVSLARAHSPRWGYSMPSQSKVAEEIGISRETVNRKLVALVKKGLLSTGTAPRKKGQWERRFYILAPLEGGIKSQKKTVSRVTQDHTAPCDFHQTRHRVTEDHTSRRVTTDSFQDSNVHEFAFRKSGGAA